MSKVYLMLLRGINVGGKNKMPMAELKSCLEGLGCENVQTYLASGNVTFESLKSPTALTKEIEAELPTRFALDTELIRVLILTYAQLRQVVDHATKGFGTQPTVYHSDAIFLIGVSAAQAFAIFDPREGVDQVWQGDLAIYSQRVSALRTKSRLSNIMSSPLYAQLTIRSWTTTLGLLAQMDAIGR